CRGADGGHSFAAGLGRGGRVCQEEGGAVSAAPGAAVPRGGGRARVGGARDSVPGPPRPGRDAGGRVAGDGAGAAVPRRDAQGGGVCGAAARERGAGRRVHARLRVLQGAGAVAAGQAAAAAAVLSRAGARRAAHAGAAHPAAHPGRVAGRAARAAADERAVLDSVRGDRAGRAPGRRPGPDARERAAAGALHHVQGDERAVPGPGDHGAPGRVHRQPGAAEEVPGRDHAVPARPRRQRAPARAGPAVLDVRRGQRKGDCGRAAAAHGRGGPGAARGDGAEGRDSDGKVRDRVRVVRGRDDAARVAGRRPHGRRGVAPHRAGRAGQRGAAALRLRDCAAGAACARVPRERVQGQRVRAGR
ncbi:hypothetical protein IWW50_006991, partial [Coemansia erecta]